MLVAEERECTEGERIVSTAVELYDTTLRDGAQMVGISLSSTCSPPSVAQLLTLRS